LPLPHLNTSAQKHIVAHATISVLWLRAQLVFIQKTTNNKGNKDYEYSVIDRANSVRHYVRIWWS
jgi:hypothetical protein